MLIRSQNKKALYNLQAVTAISFDRKQSYNRGKTETIYEVCVNLGGTLGALEPIGIYTSEEKTIKVLDMIQEVYETSCYCDTGFDSAAQMERPYLFVDNRVFQMPQDSEV